MKLMENTSKAEIAQLRDLFPRLAAVLLLGAMLTLFGLHKQPFLLLPAFLWLIWPWRGDVLVGRISTLMLLSGVVALLSLLSGILKPLLAAVVIAYLMEPLVKRFASKPERRVVGVMIGVGGGLLLIGLALLLLMPVLLKETGELLASLPRVRSASEAWFSREFPLLLQQLGLDGAAAITWLKERAPELLKQSLQVLGTSGQVLAGGIGGLAGSMLNLVLVPVFAIIASLAAPEAVRELQFWIPPERKDMVKKIGGEMNRILSGYLRGQLLVSLIVGLLTSLGLWLIGMPYPLLLGMATGLLNIIPLIGVSSMLVICLVIAGFQPEWSMMLLKVALVFAVVQGAESFLITPRVLGKSVGLHPGLALLSLLIFGSLLGPLGLILAVPLGAVLVYLYRLLKEKGSLD